MGNETSSMNDPQQQFFGGEGNMDMLAEEGTEVTIEQETSCDPLLELDDIHREAEQNGNDGESMTSSFHVPSMKSTESSDEPTAPTTEASGGSNQSVDASKRRKVASKSSSTTTMDTSATEVSFCDTPIHHLHEERRDSNQRYRRVAVNCEERDTNQGAALGPEIKRSETEPNYGYHSDSPDARIYSSLPNDYGFNGHVDRHLLHANSYSALQNYAPNKVSSQATPEHRFPSGLSYASNQDGNQASPVYTFSSGLYCSPNEDGNQASPVYTFSSGLSYASNQYGDRAAPVDGFSSVPNFSGQEGSQVALQYRSYQATPLTRRPASFGGFRGGGSRSPPNPNPDARDFIAVSNIGGHQRDNMAVRSANTVVHTTPRPSNQSVPEEDRKVAANPGRKKYATIPDYDVVLGSNHTPTLGTRIWRQVRRPYCKNGVSTQTIEELIIELRCRLERELRFTLPRDPVFWYDVEKKTKNDKIDSQSPERRILESGGEGVFGKAVDQAIKEDIINASKKNRSRKTDNIIFRRPLEGAILKARSEAESWVGDDTTKQLAAEGFKEDLDKLLPWYKEYTEKSVTSEQRAVTEPRSTRMHMREARAHEKHANQLEERLVDLMSQLFSDMKDRHLYLSLEDETEEDQDDNDTDTNGENGNDQARKSPKRPPPGPPSGSHDNRWTRSLGREQARPSPDASNATSHLPSDDNSGSCGDADDDDDEGFHAGRAWVPSLQQVASALVRVAQGLLGQDASRQQAASPGSARGSVSPSPSPSPGDDIPREIPSRVESVSSMGSQFSYLQREQQKTSTDQKSLSCKGHSSEGSMEMQASRIQKVVRGFLRRTRYQRVRQAAIQIQAEARRHLAAFNLLALRLRRSGVYVQNGYRWGLLRDCSFESNGLDRYEITKSEPILHDGSFAKVFKAVHRPTEAQVALKLYNFRGQADRLKMSVATEISVLRGLTNESNHENVVAMIDCFCANGAVSLVFELLDTTLRARMKLGPLSPTQVKEFLSQCRKGLAFCHARGFVHCNLTPEHLLLTEDGCLKIAGFGRSRALGYDSVALTHESSKLWYQPPETLLDSPCCCSSSDLWSLGVIFAEMACGQPLFRGRSQIDQLHKIFEQLGTPTEEVWSGVTKLRGWNESFPKFKRATFNSSLTKHLEPTGIELLDNLLTYNPKDRITAMEALDHPYFDEYFDDENEQVPSPNCVIGARKIFG